jgi:hypothetical protein
MGIEVGCLLEGHPERGPAKFCAIALAYRERTLIPSIRLPVVAERASNPPCCMFGIPRLHPGPDTVVQVLDDNSSVDVLYFGSLHGFSP